MGGAEGALGGKGGREKLKFQQRAPAGGRAAIYPTNTSGRLGRLQPRRDPCLINVSCSYELCPQQGPRLGRGARGA